MKRALIIGGIVITVLLFWKAIVAILGLGVLLLVWSVFAGDGSGYQQHQQPPQPRNLPQGGWDYHGNRATVARSRGEYYQVPRKDWTDLDVANHAKASSRGMAWVPGLGEVSPSIASVHYDGPGRDAYWYTSRGMVPPR